MNQISVVWRSETPFYLTLFLFKQVTILSYKINVLNSAKFMYISLLKTELSCSTNNFKTLLGATGK
ncbi:hypothetical protein EG343_24785 [Chryseobacterium nakagawai]|uniref:Uncharacterized protein n=1 Tax=Chryseobacterium nakagawai TaxID=1241982 RepID=A0AAD1DT92_CHRNA|nr:hypothetical protein EG343_24785 [Chryseobacterium nakagawai]